MATSRITNADLERLIGKINTATGMPLQPYSPHPDHKPQAGCYHLAGAYGGVALERMSLEPGCTGVTTMFGGGYRPKRELYALMQVFHAGL
jgi:hypothetical protein